MANIPQGAKRANPWIPVGHPEFKWRTGADVQATWHRYTGWTPPSAARAQVYEDPAKKPPRLTVLKSGTRG